MFRRHGFTPIALVTVATFAQAAESVRERPFDPAGAATWLGSGPEGQGSPFKLELKDGYLARPDLEASHLEEPFDADALVLPRSSAEAPLAGRFQPMIQEGETGFLPSRHFTDLARTLAIMNKLAYSRGQDYRFGHELTYHDTLAGRTLKNVSGRRGMVFTDPNAGFVAYSKALRTMAIVLHGSINTADWITNFDARKVRLDTVEAPVRTKGDTAMHVQKVRMPYPGFAHKGFLDKYVSLQGEALAAVDAFMAAMTPEERDDLKLYVSGHSQGAALAQFLTLDLCHHLRRHYGPGFVNARANRVHAWLLASPTGLDATAVAYAEGQVGAANIVVQNTWLDPVPNVGYATDLAHFQALGTPVMQSSLAAAQRAARAHGASVFGHATNGDIKEALRGLVPASVLAPMLAAMHMATDNINYRGTGHSFAFDPGMVDQSLTDLKDGLRMAYDQKQDRLRAQALQARQQASGVWGGFKAFFN